MTTSIINNMSRARRLSLWHHKKTIITILLAFVAVAGQGQVKPDTITINFQLSSKVQGEKATVVYPDFMTFDTLGLLPTFYWMTSTTIVSSRARMPKYIMRR